jgi:hypothetical protein
MGCEGLNDYLTKGETSPEYNAHIEKCPVCQDIIEKEFDRISAVFAEIGKVIGGVKVKSAPPSVTFTAEEVKEIYNFVDAMSGGNPENGFAWDGTDDINEPVTSALVKIFKSVGREIPENLE